MYITHYTHIRTCDLACKINHVSIQKSTEFILFTGYANKTVLAMLVKVNGA